MPTSLARCRISIQAGVLARARVEILIPTSDPPIEPLVVHMGQGVLFFAWTPPGTQASAYEISYAEKLSGPYQPHPSTIEAPGALIRGFLAGMVLFFRVRAIHPSGLGSAWVQVKQGKFTQNPLDNPGSNTGFGTLRCTVQAIAGSKIPQGAVFAVYLKEIHQLVAIQAAEEILIN